MSALGITCVPIAAVALALGGAFRDPVRQAPLPQAPVLQDRPAGESAAPERPAPAPAESPQPQDPAATPESAPASLVVRYEPRYHTYDEVDALVRQWIAESPAQNVLIETVELPPTAAGLGVPAFAFGAVGEIPLGARSSVLLLGGLDGVSIAGAEAVLATSATLLTQGDRLPRDVAFVAVPWASPEALRATLEGHGDRGRDLSPLDDDGDGAVDEDGPDDVDGDGRILDMLVEDPSGPYARAVDPRFLAPARASDAPRYLLVREGRDGDGDGRFNEDPAGGVCYDRAFPLGWKSERPRAAGAELPLETPLCRALADLALERRTVLVLLFQGDHGGLARPGSRRESSWPADADAPAFDIAARAFARATGRPLQTPATLSTAREGERPGAALDWFYAVPGALALEVAPWGPTVERPPETPGVGLAEARFDGPAHGGGPAHASPVAPQGTDGRPAAPPVSATDAAWARWLDNTRGGIGFVDWHPVELGGGAQGAAQGLSQVLVGGWEPRTRRNPPEKSLAAALAGMPEFVLALAHALPKLELRVLESSRDGEVCTIRARVANAGALPTSGWSSGRAAASRLRSGAGQTGALSSGTLSPGGLPPGTAPIGTSMPGAPSPGASSPGGSSIGTPSPGAQIELELPSGARLLAGESSLSLGEIAGGGASRDVSWLVLAAPGTVVTLRASAPWTAGVAREVKP